MRRIVIFDSSGNRLNRKEFNIITEDQVRQEYVSKKDLICQKILTRSQINKALKESKLSPFIYKDVVYFKRTDAMALLKGK